jgi:hypothetical protein
MLKVHVNESCFGTSCFFGFGVSMDDYPARLTLSGLVIEYEVYQLEEELLNAILDCWDKVDRGARKSDYLCREFPLPQDMIFLEPITEQNLTDRIMQRNLCSKLPNDDHGCGDGNAIDFANDINQITNVLIEYDGDERTIVIS